MSAGDNKTLPDEMRAALSAGKYSGQIPLAVRELLASGAAALEAAEARYLTSVAEWSKACLNCENEHARAEARLVAVEAERDEKAAGWALERKWRQESDTKRHALEAENAELKGLKAGSDEVACVEAWPTWVDGIRPPLEQIEADYRELVDSTCGGMAEDVLALVAEVYRLRLAAAAVRPQTDTPDETNKALHATWKATERELAEARGADWMPTSNFSATLDAMRARGLDAWVTSIEMYLGSTAYGYVQYPFIERAQAAEARCHTYEEALRDAESVCETLPGKLTVEPANIKGALEEIEWLATGARAALASSVRKKGEGLGGPQSGPSGGEQG